MKRKLVQQGSSTMMISLPSKWIKENQLGKGSEIDLEEENNKIVISQEGKKDGKKEITIELNDENKKDIKNILTHAYRRGFDKIVLKHLTGIKEVKSIVNELLLGFELTEINQNNVTIENISEPTEQKYDIMLKKAFQIIEETQEIVINDFEKNKLVNLEDIEDLKKQQDRFLLFCRRLLIKENIEKSIISSWEVLNFLMHVEHRYFYLYKFASENKIKPSKETLELVNSLKEYFNLYKKAYFEKDITSIHKINNLRNEFYFGKCIKYLEKSKGKETVVLSYIREIFRIIQLGTSPILNERLDQSTSE